MPSFQPERYVILEPNLSQDRAKFPGLVNAHSHCVFKRVLRGRTEYRTTSDKIVLDLARDDVQRRRAAFRGRHLRRVAHGVSRNGAEPVLQPWANFITFITRRTAVGTTILICLRRRLCARPMMLDCALRYCEWAYARSGFEADPNPRQQDLLRETPSFI